MLDLAHHDFQIKLNKLNKTDKKNKEKQQVGIKVPKFSADTFLRGLFLYIYYMHTENIYTHAVKVRNE